MLGRIVLFEIRYQLRRPITWISLAVFTLLAFGWMNLNALVPAAVAANAPLRIAFNACMLSIVGMFLSLATLADVALRDAETRMDEIVRTQPVRTGAYLAARFIGAFAVACIPVIGSAIG